MSGYGVNTLPQDDGELLGPHRTFLRYAPGGLEYVVHATTRTPRRRMRVLAGAFAVILGGALATISTASAASSSTDEEAAIELLVCAGTQTINYSPGLILTPRQTVATLDRDYTGCLAPTEPTITSGTHDFVTAPADRSCLTVLSTNAGQAVEEWDDGRSSTLSWTEDDITVQNVLGQQVVTVIGTVSAGVFAGHTFEEVAIALTLDVLDCVGSGVTSETGTVALTILT